MIWKRCVAEYLSQNNVRTQCSKQEAIVVVGDLVWLVDNNVKRSHGTNPGNVSSKRWCGEINASENS